MAVGTAEAQTQPGKAAALGTCVLATGIGNDDWIDASLTTFTVPNDRAVTPSTMHAVTDVLPTGNVRLYVFCNELNPQNNPNVAITYPKARLSVVALSAG